MVGATRSRVIALVALGAAVAGVAIVLIHGGGGYTLHARFADAGQLVRGGLVQVAGRSVGKIKSIDLSDDGMADVAMSIDGDVAPLHDGTRATIRAVGLASVANRYIELTPGLPDAPKIPDGGVLDDTRTKGIVDLDQLLDTLDPATRTHIQHIIRDAAHTVAKPADRQFNAGLRYLNPALSQTAALGNELTLDQAALTRLVRTAGQASAALAKRPPVLSDSIARTSQTLGALAGERAALGDTVDRAAGVFGKTEATLRHLSATLPALDPVLRDLRPAAPGLARLLRQLVPVTRNALPTFAGVQKLLPDADRALRPLPALAKQAIPALASGTNAIKGLTPILTGLRPYGPDLVAGLFEGFGGSTSGYYDANGHYSRISFEGGIGGLPGLLPAPPSGSFGGYRTGLTARCPGGAVEPAFDNSNPFDPNPGDCVKAQDQG